MPIPPPKTDETQDKYISRCMSWMAKDDPDLPQDQRLARCFSTWRGKNESMHPHFQRILDLFNKRYGKEGQNKFDYFVANHYLNTSLPYDPRAQFHESFKWAKPYLYKLREDKDAKYYAINCINAIVSMNKNDYTDWDQMMKAGESMQYRPVNVNHDHSKWLPYPRTRLDYAKAEDYAVEGILRVDNRESRLQKQIEHDPSIPEKEWISHPSIEGRPNLGGRQEGYHFLGIALLEKGHQLPGDPLSGIDPIIFESVGETKEVCLLIDDSKVCIPIIEQTPPPVCVCPECGETVNNTENKHCPELKCPKCGASMRAKPPATGGGKGQGGPPGNLEQNREKGDAMNPESEGPLQRGGAICPSCGKIVPETVTDVTEIKCPVCHTPMVVWDQKTYEMSVIPAEAVEQIIAALETIDLNKDVIVHQLPDGSGFFVVDIDTGEKEPVEIVDFNPAADWPESCYAYVKEDIRLFAYRWPDGRVSLPNVRNALARLSNAHIPESAKKRIKELMQRILKKENPDYKQTEELGELVKELFRPPFPFEPNPMFTKTTNLVYTPVPTVGLVKGKRIGIVEYTKLQADFEEYRLSKENEALDLKAKVTRMQQDYAALNDKHAELEETLAKGSAVEATLKEKLGQLGKANSNISKLTGTVDDMKRQIDSYKEAKIREETAHNETREELAKAKARLDDAITQLHESSEHSAKNTQTAINETQERARIQEENALIRKKIADLTREISGLTERMSEDADRLIRLETELKESKEKNREAVELSEAKLVSMQDEVDKARKYMKWANKALVNAGFVKLETTPLPPQ